MGHRADLPMPTSRTRVRPPARPGSAGSATVAVPGGTTFVGNDHFYAEERPVCPVVVPDLRWDRHPVTNAQFSAFVRATGHRTVPELALDPADFPGADPALLVPGSQVFTATPGPVHLGDWTQWWRWQQGAAWFAPEGAGSTWTAIPDHPVVHVGWEDAAAYAAWAGQRLPTEAEWEHAARGGLVGADYAWGDERSPGGRVLANTWQGAFPWQDTDPLGHRRTSPVGSYPANPYGLVDMIGNVWEWTATSWTADHRDLATAPPADEPEHGGSCCGGSLRQAHRVERPARGASAAGRGAAEVGERSRMVTKGGSHLCSPDYCRRYRPAARQGHGARDTTSHVGFRCVSAV